jgi:hypothetical protein
MDDDFQIWAQHIREEIENVRYQLSFKADSVSLDQIIWRTHYGSIDDPPSSEASEPPIDIDTERICYESAESGDLRLAFSAILRHINTIAQTKADRNDITGKTTLAYTDSLFNRMAVISCRQIESSTAELASALAARIDSLSKEFTDLRDVIETKVVNLEADVLDLEDQVRRMPNMKTRVKKDETGFTVREKSDSAITNITPRRQALRRSFDMARRRSPAPTAVGDFDLMLSGNNRFDRAGNL